MAYCIYLRKSRPDIAAEERGEGETLARHERILLELAKKLGLDVTQIYKELVSGDTIAARPVMQKLLSEVEAGMWDGVIVMEVERLARGDTVDQGIVAQTFKFSGTKIITPTKTYDPNNEFDEEYFEFGLFMSRREYKTINRRLQRGRLAAVKEGKYVGNRPPYGYKRVKLLNDSGFTLEPDTYEADVVRMIFDLYTNGEQEEDGTFRRLGVSLIVRRLNALKIPSRTGSAWVTSSVRDILINPVYIGKVRWNWRPAVKKMVNGKLTKQRPRARIEDCVVVDGLHPAIISNSIFEKAQELMSKNPPRPIGERNVMKNPLSGLVICGKCGRCMVRRPYPAGRHQADTLMCAATSCDNISAPLYQVENRILSALADWVGIYKMKWNVTGQHKNVNQIEVKQKALKRLESDMAELHKQRDNIHTLLEQGIYSTDVFLERSQILNERIEQNKKDCQNLKDDIQKEIERETAREDIIPKVERLIEIYHQLPSPKAKNDMLRDVLEKVVYIKNKKGSRKLPSDDFEIALYPKLPRYN